MEFSLKSLAVAIAYLAVVCAGIALGNFHWAGIILALTLFLVVFAVIHVLFGPTDRRAYWGSFAIGTASYLILTVYHESPELNDLLRPLHVALVPLHARQQAEPGFVPQRTGALSFRLGPSKHVEIGPAATYKIAHSVLAVLIGLVTAQIGQRAYRKRLQATEKTLS